LFRRKKNHLIGRGREASSSALNLLSRRGGEKEGKQVTITSKFRQKEGVRFHPIGLKL